MLGVTLNNFIFGEKNQAHSLGGYHLQFADNGALSVYKENCLVFQGESSHVIPMVAEQIVYEAAFEAPPRAAAYFSSSGEVSNPLWKEIPANVICSALNELSGTMTGCTICSSWLFLKDSVIDESFGFIVTAFLCRDH